MTFVKYVKSLRTWCTWCEGKKWRYLSLLPNFIFWKSKDLLDCRSHKGKWCRVHGSTRVMPTKEDHNKLVRVHSKFLNSFQHLLGVCMKGVLSHGHHPSLIHIHYPKFFMALTTIPLWSISIILTMRPLMQRDRVWCMEMEKLVFQGGTRAKMKNYIKIRINNQNTVSRNYLTPSLWHKTDMDSIKVNPFK